jgi:hypothetical protein
MNETIREIKIEAEREIETILSELAAQGIRIYRIQLLKDGGVNLILHEKGGFAG